MKTLYCNRRWAVLFLATTLWLSGCKKESEPTPEADKYLVSGTLMQEFSLGQVKDRLASFNSIAPLLAQSGVKSYNITYKTQNWDGSTVTASGLLVIPVFTGKMPLISYQHGTILSSADAPSNSNSTDFLVGTLLASLNYIVVAPDYIGYGASSATPHPYEHRQTLAQTSLDLMRAAREFLKKQSAVSWDDRVFLTGYSEGGFATMALQKMIEEQYSTEFKLAASSLGAGAYNKTAFMKHLINNPTTGVGHYNHLYLWVLQTYNTIYKLNRPYTAYFKEPYATEAAKGFGGSVAVSLNTTFTDAFKTGVNNGTDTAFLTAVADNDVYNWKTTTPTKLYHGDADDLVFYFNSQDAFNAMKAKGSTNIELVPLKGKNHSSAVQDYLLNTYNFFTTLK